MDKVREALEAISWTCVLGHKVVDLDEVLNILKDIDNWQPIETAPKDGTFILLYNCWYETEKRPPIQVGCWHIPANPQEKGFWTSMGTKSTHWQPLPNPPEKK